MIEVVPTFSFHPEPRAEYVRMPITLKGGPRDGETVPDTVAEIGNEFTLKHYPPADPKLSPRAAIRAAVTLTYKRTTKTSAAYVRAQP